MTRTQRDAARKVYTLMDNETGAALLDAIVYGDAVAIRAELSNMRDNLSHIEKIITG